MSSQSAVKHTLSLQRQRVLLEINLYILHQQTEDAFHLMQNGCVWIEI